MKRPGMMSNCKKCQNKCSVCGHDLPGNSLGIDSPIVRKGRLVKKSGKICEKCKKKIDKKENKE